MARKLGWLWLMVVVALAAPASASTGKITGVVRDARGTPQMGAAVEVLAATSTSTRGLTVFTDAKGVFSVPSVQPGRYLVKVSAPAFLPALRENITVKSGTQVVVNLTLNTLFEATQWLPARRRPAQEDEDWKWTLRSAANRPVLRVLDSGPLVVVTDQQDQKRPALKAQLAFIAGSEAEGFGSGPEMSTSFHVEQSLFRSGTLSFRGNLGYGDGFNNGVVRAAYRHRLPNGSMPELALTARHFATAASLPKEGALSAVALTVTDRISLFDLIEIEYGGEVQAIQFAGRTQVPFRPFGAASVHLSPNWVAEYRYATSQPSTRAEKGYASAPADLTESGPRMTLAGSAAVLERAVHQEISLSRRVGRSSFQLAVFHDKLRNAALTGVGRVSGASGQLLPDVYSGTFAYNGGELDATGVRLVAQRRFNDAFTLTVDYAFSGVLALTNEPGLHWEQALERVGEERMHTVAAKAKGEIPGTSTRYLASYRWTSGTPLLQVDAFNASASQADPYLNVYLRHPLPDLSFMPGKMEALVDVRNLLAQGYVPVIGQDGKTLYLVQSARSVRGGVAFTF